MMCPMPDFSRLASAIQARAGALGLKQKDLIARMLPEVSRATTQNLWTGNAVHTPNGGTQGRLEDALGWERGSVMTVLNGGEPTLLREPMEMIVHDVDVTAGSGGFAERRSDLPVDAQVALEGGQLVGVDVLRWEVEGESFSVTIVARAGEYGTEQKRAARMRQAEEWARIKRGLAELANPDGAGASDGGSE
jgi:hypothetical protein